MATTFDSDKDIDLIIAASRKIAACSVPIFLILYYAIPSPWGKAFDHSKYLFLGPCMPARVSWFIFESPNLVWFAVNYAQCHRKGRQPSIINLLLASLFLMHYTRRAIVYPLMQMKSNKYSKPIPLATILSAVAFCSINGYIQTKPLLAGYLTFSSQSMPLLVTGTIIFVLGFYINYTSDNILCNLRHADDKQGSDNGYVTPTGGLFTYVSTPHYFGEIVEWTGFAIALSSANESDKLYIAPWSFVLFTMANLIPRGVSHHEWYKNNITNYPRRRKAVIPFIW